MTAQNSTADSFDNNDFGSPKLPTMLNVLTILTFIGCAFWFLYYAFLPKIMSFSKEMIQKAQSSGQEISAKDAADMQKGLAQLELAEANMIPLIITGILSILLCFVGALMMRKLKKDGFWIYVAGQVVPFVVSAVMMGFAQFKELGSIFFLFITAMFIVMYSTQRKYFVK